MAYISRPLSGARLTTGQMRVGGLFHIKPKVQIHFFDRRIIRTRWRKINNNPLARAGALIMRISRKSIRRRIKLRGKPSAPGTPPYSRQPGALPPFKQIFFRVMDLKTFVIIGMVGYGAPNPPPGLQEHGGVARRKVFTKLGQKRLKSGRFGKQQYQYKPQMVKYPQRPFMQPALLRAMAQLPQLWRGSVSR